MRLGSSRLTWPVAASGQPRRFLLRQRACRLFPLELEDADFESQLADMPYLAPYESEEKMKGSFLKLGILGNYGNVWQSLNLEKRSLFGERLSFFHSCLCWAQHC